MLGEFVVWIRKAITAARDALQLFCSHEASESLRVQASRFYIACADQALICREFENLVSVRPPLHVGKCIQLSISVNVFPLHDHPVTPLCTSIFPVAAAQ